MEQPPELLVREMLDDAANEWTSLALRVDAVLFQNRDLSDIFPRKLFRDYYRDSENWTDEQLDSILDQVDSQLVESYDELVKDFNEQLEDIRSGTKVFTLVKFINDAVGILKGEKHFDVQEIMEDLAEHRPDLLER